MVGVLPCDTAGAFGEPPKNMLSITDEALNSRVLKTVSPVVALLHHHNISASRVNPAESPCVSHPTPPS